MSKYEQIDEPLSWVIVCFHSGKIEPRALRWKTREFDVAQVLSTRLDRSVRPNRTSIAVRVTTGEVMELTRREGEATWFLSRLQTD